MKKRFLALLLALALCMGLAVPAFADEPETPDTTAESSEPAEPDTGDESSEPADADTDDESSEPADADDESSEPADTDTDDESSEPAAPIFTDVPSWCADSTAWAIEKKITNGYGSADKFAPTVDCTQAQILTFLFRAVRGVEAEDEIPAASGEDMALAEEWAREKGIIDDEFDGSAPCTRATAVSYIWQALDKPEAEETASFTDVEADSAYTAAINWAVEKKVTNGYGGEDTFAPDQTCSRGEIVTFLYRAYEN